VVARLRAVPGQGVFINKLLYICISTPSMVMIGRIGIVVVVLLLSASSVMLGKELVSRVLGVV